MSKHEFEKTRQQAAFCLSLAAQWRRLGLIDLARKAVSEARALRADPAAFRWDEEEGTWVGPESCW